MNPESGLLYDYLGNVVDVTQILQNLDSLFTGDGSATPGVRATVQGATLHDTILPSTIKPVIMGGRAVDPTSLPSAVAAGDASYAGVSLQQETLVYKSRLDAGEDLTNDVQKTEQQFTGIICTADQQVKASAGFLHSVTFMCTDAAPTAGSIIIYDNTAESGAVIVNFQITTTPFNPFTLVFNRKCTAGIYVGFTTTADVSVQLTYR